MAQQPSNHLLPGLHRLAKGQDENFLTECLAYVLSTFLKIETNSAERLLECLSGPVRISTHTETAISVHTQFPIDAGAVDLVRNSRVG